jgi:hypothetical protein
MRDSWAKPSAAGTPESGTGTTTSAATGLARELDADAPARLVHAAPVRGRVGPREIDVLEDAGPRRLGREGLERLESLLADDDHLARLHFAHELGVDDVERTGLGGQDPGAVEVAEDQRADTHRVAHADHRLIGERDERVGAFDLVQRVDHAVGYAAEGAGRGQVDDDLGVGRGLEQAAAADEVAAQPAGVRQVAVVADREAARFEIGEQRLDVAHHRGAGRRIAVVADRGLSGQPGDHRLVAEIVADQPDRPVGMKCPPVIRDDAAGFLAAVLQCVHAEGGERRGVAMAVNAEDPAFLVQVVVVERVGGDHRPNVRGGRPTPRGA